jgi:hypothetical protein
MANPTHNGKTQVYLKAARSLSEKKEQERRSKRRIRRRMWRREKEVLSR